MKVKMKNVVISAKIEECHLISKDCYAMVKVDGRQLGFKNLYEVSSAPLVRVSIPEVGIYPLEPGLLPG